MKRYLLFISSIVLWGSMVAQVQLFPSIGLDNAPLDSDSICDIPFVFSGDPLNMDVGPNIGDTVPDLTLYDADGNSVTLSEELAGGTPVVLVSGSYTCPRFRGNISRMNSVFSEYFNELKIFIVYCVEAHPLDVPSPYFGYMNPGQPYYPQPKTYGERRGIVQDMRNELIIMPQILIDGPCNEWWSTYGPAENNLYVIDTNGVVKFKHGWMNMNPNIWDLSTDLDSLFGNSGNSTSDLTGSFQFQPFSNNGVQGSPGSTLVDKGYLINHSTDPVAIDVIRDVSMMDTSWASSLCLDICLPPQVDSTRTYIAANDTLLFKFYFYTDTTARMSSANVLFRNANDPSEIFIGNFLASTLPVPISVEQFEPLVYPNPTNGQLSLQGFTDDTVLRMFDSSGREVTVALISFDPLVLDLSTLEQGSYFLYVEVENGEHQEIFKVIKQ